MIGPAVIGADWARLMARYNAWQNENIVGAADTLDDEARRADRGAFFGSIAGTLSHILWADGIWLSRFTGTDPPPGSIAASPALYADWPDYKARRREMDGRIAAFAGGLTAAETTGDLTWFSGALGREISKPRPMLLIHMFNHQTHHRGQVHAMLTAAGARPSDTDLAFMPESA